MEVAALSGIIAFLVVVGGLGWKLATELAGIKTCLQVFIAKSEATERAVDLRITNIEKRVEKLENKGG